MALQDDVIYTLDNLENIQILRNIEYFSETVDIYKQRLQDNEFRIAVVGEFSSGKSTFINAFIKRDILKHGSSETTAVITRVQNVSPDSTLAYNANVTYYDNRTEKILKLDDLKEYTTTTSSKYNVVNAIKSVEVYVPFVENKHNITIIDTPGLNGMADGHREQTMDIIKSAHACIYLFSVKGISESDLKIIQYLVKYQKNFIFIQNFIDLFKSAEGESKETRLNDLKKELDEKLHGINYFVCGVSSLYEVTAWDKNITRLYSNSKNELLDEQRLYLNSKSGFNELRDLLNKEFSGKKLQNILYNGTLWAIFQYFKDTIQVVDKKIAQLNYLYKISKEKDAFDKLIKLKNNFTDEIDSRVNQVECFILDSCRNIERETRIEVKKQFEKLYDDIQMDVNKKLNYNIKVNEVETVVDNVVQGVNYYFNTAVNRLLDEQSELIILKLQMLYHMVKKRIEEYSSINKEDIENIDISFNIKKCNLETINLNYEIEKLYSEIEFEKINRDKVKDEYYENENNINKLKKEIENYQSDIKNEKDNKKRSINKLGKRPSPKDKVEEYIYERDRTGFFSWATNKIFGKKTVRETKIVKDDTAGEAWDNKVRKINYTYKQEEIKITKKIRELSYQMEDILNRNDILQFKLKESENKLKDLIEECEQLKQNRKTQIEYLKEMFIDESKMQILKQIRDNLSEEGECYYYVVESLRNSINNATNKLVKECTNQCRNDIQIRINEINMMVLQQKPEIRKEISEWKHAMEYLIEAKNMIKNKYM